MKRVAFTLLLCLPFTGCQSSGFDQVCLAGLRQDSPLTFPADDSEPTTAGERRPTLAATVLSENLASRATAVAGHARNGGFGIGDAFFGHLPDPGKASDLWQEGESVFESIGDAELQVEPDLFLLLARQLPVLSDAGQDARDTLAPMSQAGRALQLTPATVFDATDEHMQQLNRASDLRLRPMPGVDPDSGWLLASVPDIDADVLDPADDANWRAVSVGYVANRQVGGFLRLRDIEVKSARWQSDVVVPYEFVIAKQLASRVVTDGPTRKVSMLTAGGGVRGFWGTVNVSGRTSVRGLPGKWRFKNASVDGRHPEVVWFVAADFVETGTAAVRIVFTANHRSNWLGTVAVHVPLGQ